MRPCGPLSAKGGPLAGKGILWAKQEVPTRYRGQLAEAGVSLYDTGGLLRDSWEPITDTRGS